MKKILLATAIIFLAARINAQKVPVTNLVFEGAGIRGIAYAGAIKVLEEHKQIDGIKNVGGTSAGAITAMMVALGYRSDEIYRLVAETRFQQFNDGKFYFIGGINRVVKNYGWYRGHAFNHWIDKIIEAKTGNADITFRELNECGFKGLYVTATCLNKQKLVILSKHTYPDMKISDAVRISISIPLYFEAVQIDSNGRVYEGRKKPQGLDILVDGGITGNFPIFIFDSVYTNSENKKIRVASQQTIGIRIDREEQINSDINQGELAPMKIAGFKDYIASFYNFSMENLNRNTLIPEDWERTISVSSAGIGPKIRRLSKNQKELLVKSGEIYTQRFFSQK